jgi:hypothetical protein
MLAAACGVGLLGVDPLQTTLVSVSLTVVLMPVVVLPMLVIMNDERYVKGHRSGALGNALLAALTLGGALLALIVVPLQLASK